MEPSGRLSRVTGVHTLSASTQDEVAELYARSSSRLVGVLVSIGGSRADAEECAQDAYVKLLTRWDKIRKYDDPEAWVRSVAVRILVSRHRRAMVATLGNRRLATRIQEQDAGISADAVAVSVALRTLPVAQRAAVILHYVLDLPLEQIATELQIPVGTVKSRLSRARASLVPQLCETEEANDHV